MSTSVLFVFIIKVVTSQNATDACVWGRDESARDGINGQFIFQGYFSKAPWYKKQYGTDIRYMFLSNTRYVISGEEPVKGWPGLHAECATTGTSLYPWDCGLNWRVYAGQWTDDPDVYCQMGPCPEWECDAIITDIQYMGCDDIFPVKIRSNAWSNLNGDRYFYFDYPRFRWVCDESLTYSSTTSSLLAYSERTWIDTTKGSTVPILLVLSIRFSKSNVFKIFQLYHRSKNQTNQHQKQTNHQNVHQNYLRLIPLFLHLNKLQHLRKHHYVLVK
eukprot:667968_1